MSKTELAREQLRRFVDRLARPGIMHNARQGIFKEARVMGFDQAALKVAVLIRQAGDEHEQRELWETAKLYVEKGLLP